MFYGIKIDIRNVNDLKCYLTLVYLEIFVVIRFECEIIDFTDYENVFAQIVVWKMHSYIRCLSTFLLH